MGTGISPKCERYNDAGWYVEEQSMLGITVKVMVCSQCKTVLGVVPN
jgi:hypothetical protein